MLKTELNGVSFIYSRGTPYEVKALDNINLTLKAGEITGVIGHTGSGKSTLVQLLNGLLKPTLGEVLIDGEDINSKNCDIRKIRFRVGLVMQYPEYQLFDETVRSDIAFGPKNMALADGEISERVKFAAKFSDLPDELLDKSPFELSGGQKRRVALAGVIAMKPELLVLDEPAAGLDPRGRREILGRVCDYRDETGAGVLIISHSMEDMAKYCDRIIVMRKGRVMLDGTPAEVFARYNDMIAVGLDVPQITRVAADLNESGIDVGTDIYTVKFALRRLGKKFNISDETVEKVLSEVK